MDGFFLDFLSISLNASYIIIAVFFIRLIFSKIPKKYICFLWSLAGIRLVFPFSIESALSVIPSGKPVDYTGLECEREIIVDSGISTVDRVANRTISNVTSVANDYSVSYDLIIMMLICAWIVGIVSLLLYGIITYTKVKKSVSTAVLLEDNVYQCETVKSPFILGIIKPKIYVPFNIDSETKDYVLAHETAHIKRLDHIVKPLAFLVLSIHWFNPFVLLAYILLCRDIEKACDERVIAEMEGDERKAYATALLSCAVNGRKITVCPLAFGEVSVKDRIKSVMNYKKPVFWVIIIAVIACMVVAVCFLTNPKETEHFYDSGYRINVTVEADGKVNETKTVIASRNGIGARLSNGTKFEIEEANLQTGEYTLKLSGTPLYSEIMGELKGPTGSIVVLDNDSVGITLKSADGKENYTFKFIHGESMDIAISRAIAEHQKKYYPDADFFASDSEFLDAEILKKDSDGNIKKIIVYTMSAYETFGLCEDGIENKSGGSCPCALTFEIDENCSYVLVDYWRAEDGSNHIKSVYDKFPPDSAKKVFDIDYGYLWKNLEKKAEAHYQRGMVRNYGYWGDANETVSLTHSTIRLGDNGKFQFMISPLSSYIGIGTYTMDSEKLIMKTDDGMNTYTFDVGGDNLIFNAAESSKMPVYNKGDGSKFEAVPDGAVYS